MRPGGQPVTGGGPRPGRSRAQPTQARAVATRSQILAAADRVLERDGGDRLTTAAVAAEAGVAAGTVYRYFADRDALMAEVLEASLRGIVADLADALAAAERRPAMEAVEMVVSEMTDAFERRAEALEVALGVEHHFGFPSRVRFSELTALLSAALVADVDTSPTRATPEVVFVVHSVLVGTSLRIALNRTRDSDRQEMIHRCAHAIRAILLGAQGS